jgi:hypothetical protein
VAETAKKKWKSRSKRSLEDQLQDLHVAGTHSSSSGSQGGSSTVTPEFSGITVEEEVMERFFFDWVIEEQYGDEESVEGKIPRKSIAFLPCLPEMFRAALKKPKSVLVESVTALAFANYGQRIKWPKALTRAIEAYSSALNLLKQVILSPATDRKDEILVSIVLLGMYEVGILSAKMLDEWARLTVRPDHDLILIYRERILDRTFKRCSDTREHEIFARFQPQDSRGALWATIHPSGRI